MNNIANFWFLWPDPGQATISFTLAEPGWARAEFQARGGLFRHLDFLRNDNKHKDVHLHNLQLVLHLISLVLELVAADIFIA